jgi:hypothetical protein
MAANYGFSFAWTVTTPITNLGAWQVLATTDGLIEYGRVVGAANLIGATGGTLDIAVQTNYGRALGQAGVGFWKDIARFTQLGAGAAAASFTLVFTRGGSGTATAPTAANATDATPTITVNTVNPQTLGDSLRLLVLPGAGTTAGAALAFSFDASP